MQTHAAMVEGAVLLLLLLLSPPSDAFRATGLQTELEADEACEEGQQEVRQADEEGQQEAASGQMLRDRYVLEKFIETRGSAGADPGVSFPSIVRRNFSSTSHLRAGSFGDVWEAYDRKLGRKVAVKIFYSKSGSKKRYLTWQSASRAERLELEKNVKECTLIQQIMKHRDAYPAGANAICECYDEHISDAKGTSKNVFLVQEHCGRDLDSHLERLKSDGAKRHDNDLVLAIDLKDTRTMMKQLLEGIAFLNMFSPELIHHDLKPANVVSDGSQLKIIDWGGVVFAKPENRFKSAVATPLYTPPEASGRLKSFEMPEYSYDVYAAGLIYMELLCPTMDTMSWYSRRPLSGSVVTRLVTASCPKMATAAAADLRLIGDLIAERPDKRMSPMDALLRSCFNTVSTPASAGGQRLKYRVGDLVEYYSSTHKKYIAGVIAKVNEGEGTYNINLPNGEPMKNGADPAQVRHRDVKATVAESFKVPPGRWVAQGGGNGIATSGVLRPVKVEGNQVGELPYSTYLELTTPTKAKIHGVLGGAAGIKITSFLSCRLPATCSSVEAILTCGRRTQNLALTQHTTSFWKVELRASSKDPRIGSLCELVAVASVTLRGETTRSRSFKQFISFDMAAF